MTKTSDRIRSAAARRIQQARQAGRSTVSIQAGEIVKELGLRNLTPSVCSVLVSKRIQEDNFVHLETAEGPPSGQSTTMLYTYKIVGSEPESVVNSKFMAMRGLGKSTFGALGGGEEFILRERRQFYE